MVSHCICQKKLVEILYSQFNLKNFKWNLLQPINFYAHRKILPDYYNWLMPKIRAWKLTNPKIHQLTVQKQSCGWLKWSLCAVSCTVYCYMCAMCIVHVGGLAEKATPWHPINRTRPPEGWDHEVDGGQPSAKEAAGNSVCLEGKYM